VVEMNFINLSRDSKRHPGYAHQETVQDSRASSRTSEGTDEPQEENSRFLIYF
jgi:hypothetical protein